MGSVKSAAGEKRRILEKMENIWAKTCFLMGSRKTTKSRETAPHKAFRVECILTGEKLGKLDWWSLAGSNR